MAKRMLTEVLGAIHMTEAPIQLGTKPGFNGLPSRAEIQRMRAARLHDEERALERASAIRSRSQLNEMRAKRAHNDERALAVLDAADAARHDAAARLPGRAAVMRLRAARAHEEERELAMLDGEANTDFTRAPDPNQEEPQTLSRSELQRIRAARLHAEECDLEFSASLDFRTCSRVRLQQMRAARLHNEERELENAAAFAALGDDNKENEGSSRTQLSRQQLQRLRAARSREEEQVLESAATAEKIAAATANEADEALEPGIHFAVGRDDLRSPLGALTSPEQAPVGALAKRSSKIELMKRENSKIMSLKTISQARVGAVKVPTPTDLSSIAVL